MRHLVQIYSRKDVNQAAAISSKWCWAQASFDVVGGRDGKNRTISAVNSSIIPDKLPLTASLSNMP